jgi:copper resistance protein B
LILTPKIETNVYDRAEPRRNLGTGVGNVDLGVRMRYEITRKFAPYVGYVWDRALGNTADRLRAAGEPIIDSQFVAGIRLWW